MYACAAWLLTLGWATPALVAACPTKKMPDVTRCHTWLALQFIRTVYPDVKVCVPDDTRPAHDLPPG